MHWQYRIVDSQDVPHESLSNGRADVETYLNTLGQEGWEIINLDFREMSPGRLAFSGIAKRQVNE
ncbi:MAG: hypothetical protein HYV26_16340 [Candidatus Hydrogenedentes bacterium]|nr:hypothetical protein [Candidatus Hydrogenedentota bacterium]MBI3119634.1 hypothetical protein [Candidatus Hydrogenedentota bacterium]